MIQPAILEKLAALPESLQTEVLHYIEFLSERYSTPNGESESPPQKQRGGLGILKGKIRMSEDFDEPLEEMQEYM